MTLLVVGASGFLGAEVCRQAVAVGERVVGTYHARVVDLPGVVPLCLDVRDRAAVRELVARVRPDTVVATPYVYGDWAVTADGAANIAYASTEVGARLVHLSSDAVHGGRPEPYGDDDPPSPVFPYGAAKAAAETAVRVLDPAAALVRTSLIVGEGSKQIQLCIDAIDGRASLFTDELRCPVDVVDLAAAVLELAGTDFAGLLNVAGPDAVSRAEMGLLVARRYGLDPSRMRTCVGAESGLQRPTEVRLDSARAGRLLRTRLRGVREILAG